MFLNCTRSLTRTCSAATLIVAAGLLLSTGAMAEQAISHYDIPAENAAKALLDFSRQAGVQILYPYDEAAKHNVAALKGDFSQEDALAKLLAGTGLEIASRTDKTISLRVVGAGEQSALGAGQDPTQVVVTGTRIRNARPTSPVQTVSRKEIDQSGYADVGQVIRSLPENFSGGQNPGVIAASATNAYNHNDSNAASVNLRGIGTDATLVLLNGRRLSGDSAAQGGDISGIPLGAVQRIEVVTDGASAQYGSDAVAGVVNFILRKDFNGAELTGSVGNTTAGGGGSETYSALVGHSGTDWHVLVNLEEGTQHALTAEDRHLSSAVPETTLIQPQTRHSLFVSAGKDFGERVAVSVDALVADRRSTAFVQTGIGAPTYYTDGYSPSYNVAGTVDVGLTGSWKMHFTAARAGGRNSNMISIPAYAYKGKTYYKNDVSYAELVADGTAFSLPGGDVKVAIGGGYRAESFQQGVPGVAGSYAPSRNVTYAFAEALLPLVSSLNARPGIQQLDLSLSARAEQYNDFGNASTPKIGIRYVPITGLALRATWGKSFKAPSFQQAYSSSDLYLWNAPDVGGAGNGKVLMTFGGNPNLKPEESTSWTFGGDYSPKSVEGLTFSGTMFKIDYTNRVVIPVAVYPAALSDPQYAPFIEGPPSAARQAELIAAADGFYNYSNAAYDPAHVIAVINDTFANATSQKVEGFDLSYRQRFAFSTGQISAFANATWIKLDQQTIISVPIATLSGTIFNVPELKARGGMTFERGGFSATFIANYIEGETDTGLVPYVPIASWTTADTTLSYRFADSSGFTNRLRVSFSVSNLFDKKPPYAGSPSLAYAGINYDSTNTSAIGRFVSLSISKGW